nr:hypothetical protein CcurKRNrm1_p158 [Cryptomonas curvata]
MIMYFKKKKKFTFKKFFYFYFKLYGQNYIIIKKNFIRFFKNFNIVLIRHKFDKKAAKDVKIIRKLWYKYEFNYYKKPWKRSLFLEYKFINYKYSKSTFFRFFNIVIDSLFGAFFLLIYFFNNKKKKLSNNKSTNKIVKFKIYSFLNINAFTLFSSSYSKIIYLTYNVKILIKNQLFDFLRENNINKNYYKFICPKNYIDIIKKFYLKQKSKVDQMNQLKPHHTVECNLNCFYTVKMILGVIKTKIFDHKFYIEHFELQSNYLIKYFLIFIKFYIGYNLIYLTKLPRLNYEYKCQLCSCFVYRGFESFYNHFFNIFHIKKLLDMKLGIGEERKFLGICKNTEIFEIMKKINNNIVENESKFLKILLL